MHLAEILTLAQHSALALSELLVVHLFAAAEQVAEDELLSVEQVDVQQSLVATCLKLPLRLLLRVLLARSDLLS